MIYEYRCEKGHKFEINHTVDYKDLVVCPECSLEAKKIITGGSGFIFKCKGFYKTDKEEV